MKTKRIIFAFGVTAFCTLTIFSFQNCSSKNSANEAAAPSESSTPVKTFASTTTNSTENIDNVPALVAPPSASVNISQTLQLAASGGKTPYKYAVADCTSTIDSSTGLFTASSDADTCVIVVTDAAMQTAYSTVEVLASLSATSNPARAHVKDSVVINVSGGKGPYQYNLISGAGTLVDNVYKAPASAENAVITVTDANNQSLNVTLNILIPDGSLSAVSVVKEGQSCPAGFQAAGGTLVINFDTQGVAVLQRLKKMLLKRSQTLCVQAYNESQSSVITDVSLGLGRSQSKACQDGYTEAGKFNEIIDGSVSGASNSRFLCVKSEAVTTATSFVKNLYFAALCDAEDSIMGVVGKVSAAYLARLKAGTVVGPKVQLLCKRTN